MIIQSPSHEPGWNLALEEVFFSHIRPGERHYLLWQNRPAVILGQYQNPAEEIHLPYARARGIAVVRRLSGGGCVYHDLGGLNFSCLCSRQTAAQAEAVFCRSVLAACRSLGIPARAGGRNDLTVNGRKFSGAASYEREGKLIFHGCLLICSDLTVMAQVLTPPEDKFQSHAVSSVSSRVVNLRDYCPELTPAVFARALLNQLPAEPVENVPKAWLPSIDSLQKKRYQSWDWNFGSSPLYTVIKRRRFPGCGAVTAQMEISGGKIAALSFSGDFFSSRPPARLADRLTGCSLRRDVLAQVLSGVDLTAYFHHIRPADFLDFLAF